MSKLRGQHARVEKDEERPAREASPPANGSGKWVRCKLTAELVEDAHPGSGSGAAGVDALVARDREERPVIWASHLEGVLRDAARRLRHDSSEMLFGKAGGQRQRFILTSLYVAQDPGCRVWRSAARDSFENRAPKDDTLRAIEFVPKGTLFEGSVELSAGDVPLLDRLIAEVDAIGRGRAAGEGRVKLTLAETKLNPRPVGRATSRLLLLLRNIDPISITATATPTNLIPALPFIPGRSLLGALAEWLWADNEQDAATKLVSGRISVSDALPLPKQPTDLAAVDVSPAPLSLRSEKPLGTSGETPWWALPDSPPRRVDQWLAENKDDQQAPKLKRPETDLFVCRLGPRSSWTAYRPFIRVRLRNGRPDPAQPDPSLFAIEQIAEGTLFLAEIQGDATEMATLGDALRPVLEGRRWLRIGRGGAPVEVVRAEWVDFSNSGAGSSIEAGQAAYLTLTSDLLVRDERLRWLTALDDSRMALIPGWPNDTQATPVTQDHTPVYGFNGTARLWRQPATAVRRGSVFRVEGAGIRDLTSAAANGRWLGERTHEGFGRFRLDTVLPGIKGDAFPAPLQELHSSADEASEVTAATTRRWFDQHTQLADAGTSRPSLSQWLDLASDLDRGVSDALNSRMNPTTAGKRSWRDGDARAVLGEIQRLPNQQAEYARMFVRWLRARMREKTA